MIRLVPRIGRTSAAITLLFALCFSFAGCKNLVPKDTGDDPAPTYQVLRLRWIKPLLSTLPNFLIPELAEEHDRFNPIETASAAFDTEKKRAFIGASAGGMFCLDIADGQIVWRFPLSDAVGSEPLYDASRKALFFGADDGKMYSLHARSGRKLWDADTGAEVRKKPILLNDTLYIINADNTVLALNPDSGETVWQYRRPPLKGFSGAGHSGIILTRNKLIAGFSDGYLVALDPITGAAVWDRDLAAEVDVSESSGQVRLVDADATPTVVDNVLVGASVDGGLQGVNVDTGNVLWTNPDVTTVTGLAESGGIVYAARSTLGLSALDPKTGKVLWFKGFPAGNLSDPIVYDDLMLVSDSMWGLAVLSLTDGTVLQRINQSEGMFARPSIYGGYLLVLGNGGTLYAMSIL